jgi:hypothetical protein
VLFVNIGKRSLSNPPSYVSRKRTLLYDNTMNGFPEMTGVLMQIIVTK